MDRRAVAWIVSGCVVVTVCACVTVLLLHGPADVVSMIAAGLAGAATLLGKPLVLWLLRDTDGDGVPDVVDDT